MAKKQKTKKRNGEGSIVWDSAREKWRASITVSDDERPQKRFDTWDEADAWLTEIKNSVLKNTYIPADNITVGQWIVQWLTVYKRPVIRENTLIRYKQVVAHAEPIANIKLQEITTPTIQDFLNTVDMSANGKNKLYMRLSEAFAKAYSLRMLQYNPMLEVPFIAEPKPKIEIFNWFEVRKIIGKLSLPHAPAHLKKYYPLVLLALSTGMRMGEILGLQTKSLNLARAELYVCNSLQDVAGKLKDCPPKTNAGYRTLPLLQEVKRQIEWQLNRRKIIRMDGSEYVFQTLKGTPIFAKNLNRTWHKILEYCDVPYKNFHVLRHTYATTMLEHVPVNEVAAKLGHADASYTLTLYGHEIPGYQKTYLEKSEVLIS